MILQQFEAKGLSQFSYAVADRESGEMAITDPERDITAYTRFAEDHGLKITYVLETHLHSDFVSGARALAAATGAKLLLPTKEHAGYSFDHQPVKEGDSISLGNISIKAVATPGHTAEHLSYLVSEGGKPAALLSGDSLMSGSIARPETRDMHTREVLVTRMYHTLQNAFEGLPDELPVYPGHGAGALCNVQPGAAKSTTLGEERNHNPWLQMDEAAFAEALLKETGEMPAFYSRLNEINLKGAEITALVLPKAMTPEEFAAIANGKHTIIDLRHPLTYGGGHIEGALNMGSLDQLAFWASWFVPYDKPFYLVPDDEAKLPQYMMALARMGLTDAGGYLKPGFPGWVNKGYDFTDLPQASIHTLRDFKDFGEKMTILDVRSAAEFAGGHIKGAKNIYLGDIPARMKELGSKEDAIFCICGGGTRSSVAASLLLQKGFDNVYNVYGGMKAWLNAGLGVAVK